MCEASHWRSLSRQCPQLPIRFPTSLSADFRGSMRRGISRGASGVFVAVALAVALVLLSRLTVPDDGRIPGLVLPPSSLHAHDGVVQAAPATPILPLSPVAVPPPA